MPRKFGLKTLHVPHGKFFYAVEVPAGETLVFSSGIVGTGIGSGVRRVLRSPNLWKDADETVHQKAESSVPRQSQCGTGVL